MLADGTVPAQDPDHRTAHLAGSPRTPTVGGRTTCPACRHRGTGSRSHRAGVASAPAGRRDARCPSTPGSTRPAPRIEPHARVTCEVRGRDLVRFRTSDRPRPTRRTLPSSAATGSPWPIDATAAAVYGPTPGSRVNASASRGTRPPVLSDDDACGLVQRDGAPVVASPAHALRTSAREAAPNGADVGEARDERVEDRLDTRRLRLLEHHLGDQGPVGVPAPPPPRVRVTTRPVPVQHSPP